MPAPIEAAQTWQGCALVRPIGRIVLAFWAPADGDSFPATAVFQARFARHGLAVVWTPPVTDDVDVEPEPEELQYQFGPMKATQAPASNALAGSLAGSLAIHGVRDPSLARHSIRAVDDILSSTDALVVQRLKDPVLWYLEVLRVQRLVDVWFCTNPRPVPYNDQFRLVPRICRFIDLKPLRQFRDDARAPAFALASQSVGGAHPTGAVPAGG